MPPRATARRSRASTQARAYEKSRGEPGFFVIGALKIALLRGLGLFRGGCGVACRSLRRLLGGRGLAVLGGGFAWSRLLFALTRNGLAGGSLRGSGLLAGLRGGLLA